MLKIRKKVVDTISMENYNNKINLIGLNSRADCLINEAIYIDTGEIFNLGGGNYLLLKYLMPDSTIYFEFLQVLKTDFGLYFFTALKDTNGSIVPESLWTLSEIVDTINTP